MPKILVIEDDQNIQKLLQINLGEADFQVIQALDGIQGLHKAEELGPDLIILDINLPRMIGTDVCKILKGNASTKHIPIIILTVRKDEIDRVLGFEIGVDDYVTKPFSPRELILRVRSVLRRKTEQGVAPTIQGGDIVLDEGSFGVTVSGQPIALTVTEFKLLKEFLLNKEHVFSREALLEIVWGVNAGINTRRVDAHVKSLRKKLRTPTVEIVTIFGMGYKLTEHVQAHPE